MRWCRLAARRRERTHVNEQPLGKGSRGPRGEAEFPSSEHIPHSAWREGQVIAGLLLGLLVMSAGCLGAVGAGSKRARCQDGQVDGSSEEFQVGSVPLCLTASCLVFSRCL
jgi:hypothetical protein